VTIWRGRAGCRLNPLVSSAFPWREPPLDRECRRSKILRSKKTFLVGEQKPEQELAPIAADRAAIDGNPLEPLV
jgi:hypothetical protein